MTDQHDRLSLRLAIRLLTATAIGIALSALLGYVSHRATLIALTPAWQGMSILTAAGIVAIAVATSYRPAARWGRAWMGTAPSLTVATMLAVLASHLMVRADMLSPWAARALAGLPPASSGQVSVATAVCFCLLGTATLARLHALRCAGAVVELAANAALLVAGAALLGYLYRVSDLYGMYVFNTMSPQSALSIACLAVACLIGEPTTRLGMALRAPGLGVRQLRKLLALPAIPIVLGWILSHLTAAGVHGNGASMALLVIGSGAPMFYLVLENTRAMALLDRERAAQRHHERRLTNELQTRLDEQTSALASSHTREVESIARTELAKRSEIIAQLTGSIAHDFNNLLMVIGGSAQLLKLRIRGDLGLMPLVEKISVTVTNAAKLTGQLSAFSQTQRLQATPVHVDAVMRAALAEQGPATPAVRIVVELAAGPCQVLSESAQLQLAFGHLIRNGLEAIGEHGTLHVSTSRRSTGDGAHHAIVRIVDDGSGMTPEQRDRATEPFFTTKRGNHHGLGLAQAASVVQQASGVLHITSATAHGTTIELVLPCSDTKLDSGRSGLRPAAPARSNRRLLLIDDDDEVRAVLAGLLREMDYDLIEASDGETGLRLLGDCQPALVIIDFLMPGMNGAEVARRARSLMPNLSIIFISGYADSKAISEIPHSRLLKKPVVAEELSRTIEDVLQSS